MATKCRDRLHELVKEEVESKETATMEWKNAMERSFYRMDKELISWNKSVVGANCRCELQTPECDAVGSTAVVAIVTPDKIIVANCGDSRAVLCRNGKPIPLSTDHKVSFRSASTFLAVFGRMLELFYLNTLLMTTAGSSRRAEPDPSRRRESHILGRAARLRRSRHVKSHWYDHPSRCRLFLEKDIMFLYRFTVMHLSR